MQPLQTFISYSSSDSALAGKLKDNLETFGFDVFLAHEDIEPSVEWQGRILEQLKITQVFLPLLTQDFAKSNWTDQETGIALTVGSFILPLKIDADPYGFISKYQAFKLRTDDVLNSAIGIAKVVHDNSVLREPFLDGLIDSFAHSISFDDARLKCSLLEVFDDYSTKQINEILKVSIENNQIYGCWAAQTFLRRFIARHSASVDDFLASILQDKIK